MAFENLPPMPDDMVSYYVMWMNEDPPLHHSSALQLTNHIFPTIERIETMIASVVRSQNAIDNTPADPDFDEKMKHLTAVRTSLENQKDVLKRMLMYCNDYEQTSTGVAEPNVPYR